MSETTPYCYRYPIPDSQLSPYGTRFWHSPYHLLGCFAVRPKFSAEFGITNEMHERDGLTIVPRKAVQEWFAPIVIPEGVEAAALIEVYPMALGDRSFTFRYRIYQGGDAKRRLRSEIKVRFVFLDTKTGQSVPVYEAFRQHILKVNPDAATAESI